MPFVRFTSLILLLYLAATPAPARTVSLGLNDVGAYTLRHNPALAAARLRIEEARGRMHQAGRLANPELEGSFAQNTRMQEREGELGFVQKFPLTARLRLEKQVSRDELAAAEAEVRDEERKAIASARAAAVKLLANAAQRSLRESQLANSRQLEEFTIKRVQSAEGSVAEATLVGLEARQLETELLQLQLERATFLGDLRPLLGAGAADEIAIRGELAPPAGAPGRGADASSRPDVQAARARVDAARTSAALARAQKWEDIGVGLSMRSELTEDAPEGFRRDEMLGLRFSLPLPVWNNNAGRVREADATAARRAKEVDALTLVARSEAETARAEMATLAQLIATLSDTLLPASRQLEEQLRAAQATGQTPLTEVLRARDRRLLIERQRIDALRDYHLARVRHQAATARSRPGAAF